MTMKRCRLSKLIARMRNLLDDIGSAHALPRSSVQVDEDFWYMRGRKGTICMSADNVQEAAWPCMSIFHLHSSGALS